MKWLQFRLADLNPDGMLPGDLDQWLAFIGIGRRPQVAKQWFPGQKNMYKHTRNIRNYLINKKVAYELRVNGRIKDAVKYEDICDKIYKELPVEAKW